MPFEALELPTAVESHEIVWLYHFLIGVAGSSFFWTGWEDEPLPRFCSAWFTAFRIGGRCIIQQSVYCLQRARNCLANWT